MTIEMLAQELQAAQQEVADSLDRRDRTGIAHCAGAR